MSYAAVKVQFWTSRFLPAVKPAIHVFFMSSSLRPNTSSGGSRLLQGATLDVQGGDDDVGSGCAEECVVFTVPLRYITGVSNHGKSSFLGTFSPQFL